MSVFVSFLALLFCLSLGSVVFHTISLNLVHFWFLPVYPAYLCPSVQSLCVFNTHDCHSAALIPCHVFRDGLHGRVTIALACSWPCSFLPTLVISQLYYWIPCPLCGGQWLVVEYLPSMPSTSATKNVGLGGGQCWHTPLILAIGKQRQTDLCLRAARATQKKTCLRKLRDGRILAVKNKWNEMAGV